jgi:hypothetical protein
MLVLAATFFASATAASAETITDKEPVVLENGETALGVTEMKADAVTTVSGSEIRCRRVHGWHGLKHPLFGYFYWFSERRDGSCWLVARSCAEHGLSLLGVCRHDAWYRAVFGRSLAIG